MNSSRPPPSNNSATGKPNADRWGEIIRYAIIGVLSTLIYYGLYLLALPYFKPALAYLIGYATGVVFSVSMNMKHTFKTGFHWRFFIGFTLVYVISMGIGAIALELFLKTGIPAAWAGLPVILVVMTFNFVGMRTLAYWQPGN